VVIQLSLEQSMPALVVRWKAAIDEHNLAVARWDERRRAFVTFDDAA
jgi:hypothetical protein